MNSLTSHTPAPGVRPRKGAGFVALAWSRGRVAARFAGPPLAGEAALRAVAKIEADPIDDLLEDELDAELDMLDWPTGASAPRAVTEADEWRFWGLLMCMALVALPLIGARWASPQGALRGAACAQTLLWALPVVLALPPLFVGCVAELVKRPDARTASALGSFSAAMALAVAATLALLT